MVNYYENVFFKQISPKSDNLMLSVAFLPHI